MADTCTCDAWPPPGPCPLHDAWAAAFPTSSVPVVADRPDQDLVDTIVRGIDWTPTISAEPRPGERIEQARERAEREQIVRMVLHVAARAATTPVAEPACTPDLLRRAEAALRQLSKAVLVVAPTLKKPYPDAPGTSPWDRFVQAPASAAYGVAREIHAALASEGSDRG